MEYTQFKEEVKNQLRGYLPEELGECEIKCFKKYKVNQELDAVSLVPSEHMQRNFGACPVFYMQDLYDLYESGNELEQILRYVSYMMQTRPSLEEIKKAGFQMEPLQDSVVLQVINYDRNLEMLKELPHRRFLDLAVIYRAVTFDRDGMWSGVTVTHDILESWGLTEEELYEKAYKHTAEVFPFQVKQTEEVLQEETPEAEPMSDMKQKKIMYVVTTDRMQFGAAAFLYPEIMKQTAEKYGNRGFLILPGSVHELYFINDSMNMAAYWKRTVKYANETLVREEEWLSDHVYYYNAENKTINVLW